MSDAQPEEVSLGRSAVLLLSTCLVSIVAIWLLNASLYTMITQYRAVKKSSLKRQAMLDRFRSYHLRSPDFYSRFILARIGPEPWIPSSKLKEYRARATEFGNRAAHSLATAKNPEALKEKMSQDFALLFGNISEEKLSVRDLELLANPYSSENWPTIAQWIVYDSWGESLKTVGPLEDVRVSYFNRNTRWWTDIDQYELLNARLSFEGEANANNILATDYLNATKLATGEGAKEDKKGELSALGMSVSIADALCVVPIILLLLSAQFLVMRNRAAPSATLAFPQYGSPNDPLLFVGRADVYDWLKNALWSCFLVAPVLIVTFGLVFRYDFATPLAFSQPGYGLGFWAASLRADSPLDATLDTVNLSVGIAMLFFVYTCTVPSDSIESLRQSQTWPKPLIISFALVAAGAVAMIALSLRSAPAFNFAFDGLASFRWWYCVGTVWVYSIALLVSIVIGMLKRRRFFVILSMVLLAALTALLFSPHLLDSAVRGADF